LKTCKVNTTAIAKGDALILTKYIFVQIYC